MEAAGFTPSIPDLLGPLVKLLGSAGTDAGTRVGSRRQGGVPGPYGIDASDLGNRPTITVGFDALGAIGGAASFDNRIAQSRIEIQCRARTYPEAWRLAMQVRDVFLPPANVVDGYYGTVDGVEIWGTREDAPPRESTDARNIPRVIATYLTNYNREVQ